MPASRINVMVTLLKGFAFSASLIIAIGSQNAFVLRQGLKREYILLVVLICACADALLIALGAGGMGTLIAQFPLLTQLASWFGAIFLVGYAIFSFRAAYKGNYLSLEDTQAELPLNKIIMMTLAFTFLNPHVYLDTVLLLGSLAAQYEPQARLLFALGAIMASFGWFFALGYGARVLSPLFQQARAWRVLDIIIGCVMLWLAWSLLLSH